MKDYKATLDNRSLNELADEVKQSGHIVSDYYYYIKGSTYREQWTTEGSLHFVDGERIPRMDFFTLIQCHDPDRTIKQYKAGKVTHRDIYQVIAITVNNFTFTTKGAKQ